MLTYETDVCIVGGGPAGMVCGLLLAEQGIRTLVIEGHPDFEREYRGEVLMPRFLQAMKQVGLFEHLMRYPHLKLQGFELYYRTHRVAEISVEDIAKEAPFILWMPQPVMLNAFHDRAKKSPAFDLWFNTSATDLIYDGSRVAGVRVLKGHDAMEVRAKVTVGADGRGSILRKKGGFKLSSEAHAFDVIWFTIPKPAGYDDKVRAFFSDKHNYLALPKFPGHVQCGIIVETGAYARYRASGIDTLRRELLSAHPMIHEFARSLKDFSPFNVLAAKAELVQEWARDGLLLVGDAAHTCSPAGAIGVSVAVATAIVAADVIADAMKADDFSKAMLGRVQVLREKDVRDIQGLQERAAGLISARNPATKALAFLVVMILAKTRLFARIQRRLMVMEKPLPIKSHPEHSTPR